jgi:hypothetical protein
MSKAVEGAALLAGAVGMGAAAFFDPALIASPLFDKTMEALVLGGISMEAAAIAGALMSNRGINITTRQAAAFRQVIYGQQRVGGVTIYESTTGSSHDQYNYVIVLAGHECYNIENLYLDGRQVYWQGSGVGWCVRNGVGFGGIADGNNHTGPDGQQYNFGGTGHSGIYCEARFGDQTDPISGTNSPGNATWTGTPTSVIGGLTANDGNWAPDGHGGAPWLGGCCYVYLKIEANSSLFPAPPEIRFTVNGKCNIFDPRTSTTGFTQNWALICGDVLTDPVFGLGDSSVNQAQLIAAANVCDELVEVGALSSTTATYEAQYVTNHHYDTSTGPGDVLATMMTGAAGRLSRIGGEWYVWPAYWQGPSFTFDENALTAAPQWKPYRSIRDLFNRVRGTYCAPNYPFNVAGNLYDANGFYNGQIQNNFNFAFQQTSYPEYACDTLHGYASDQYLTADGGRQLVKELNLPTVLSVTQAQRVAKITLLRNRQQGSGTFTMGLPSYGIQPCDTLQFTFPEFGWAEKTLEVISVGFQCEQMSTGMSDEKAMAITLNVGVIEADQSVYEWSTTEELTVYDVPATPSQQSLTPAPPTDMSLTSSLATALVGLDGVVHPRVEVQWNTPLDVLTRQIQIQYQLAPPGGSAGAWLDGGTVDVSLNSAFVGNVISGQTYNFRIRSVRANGASSAWDELDGFTVSLVLTVLTQDALAEMSLTSIAYSSGTASIFGTPFIAPIGNQNISVAPNNYPLSGLNQNQLYYVYYIDTTFAGDAVTVIATQNTADFMNKAGYFLIGSIVTAVLGGGIAATGPWYPSAYADRQNGAAFYTSNPTALYAPNATSFAAMYGCYISSVSETLSTDIIYSGFAPTGTVLSGVTAGLTVSRGNLASVGSGGTYTITISLNGGETWNAVETAPAPGTVPAGGIASYTIPNGTDIGQVQVQIGVSPVVDSSVSLATWLGPLRRFVLAHPLGR